MNVLYLTLAGIDDRSFGGAIRGNDIRAALLTLGDVDTLVIHGASQARLDVSWDAARVKQATFSRFGLSVEALRQRWRIRRWVAGVLADGQYDAVVARYLGLALYVPLRCWSRLVLDADDIFKTAVADADAATPSWASRGRVWLRNAVAGRLLARAGHVWFVNPKDASRAPSGRSSLLGNAVALPAPDRAREPAVPGRILMVGYFAHPPNAEGLRWFAAAVLPELRRRHPGAELHVVGKCPAELERGFDAGVRIRGFVTAIDREYDQAALVIAPIRSGGGTQIKVIEALAHGRPLVASPFAHLGFAALLRDGRDLLVAADAAAWIERCDWVLAHPDESAAMASRAAVVVRDSFGRDRLASAVVETVRQVVAAQTRP